MLTRLKVTVVVLVTMTAIAGNSDARDALISYQGEKRLNGYLIGAYPKPPRHLGANYATPTRLIEVTEQNQDQPVSKHFKLRQFLCKQESDWPKYVVIEDRLLQMLEKIHALLREHDIHTDTLHVMSGYRTPAYNASLGNAVFSRHIYGDAADIFVDADNDEMMDDLNADGRIDVEDARWLAALIERHQDDHFVRLTGGLSAYPATEFHGPFVHVDTRGKKARWGQAQKNHAD